MKSKVGIITFHAAWNYGAVLQCTALYKKLESMGYEVKVIDYQPFDRTERVIRNPFREAFKMYKSLADQSFIYKVWRTCLRFIRRILDLTKIPLINRRKCGFEIFRERYLPMTCRYKSLEELRNNPPEFEMYVCGSDQLWNASLTGDDYDPAYFLKFGERNVKRIAYAVSACNIKDRNDKVLDELLANLDFISLRERKNQRIIEKHTDKEVCICPDPTLLLSKEEYENMEKEVKMDEPYAFVYLLAKENAVDLGKEIIKEIKKKLHISIIDASPNCFIGKKGIITKSDLSPGEWLYMIHQAQYVITNSFHCFVLASIYKKKCIILPCGQTNMERLEEYAQNTGLLERIIYKKEDIKNIWEIEMDYERVASYQKEAQRIADAYLKKACSHLKN